MDSQPDQPLILVVDDDRSMRSLLNLAMTEEGYGVVEAKDGEQCLSEYMHYQPDMVLLDAVMPGLDGFTCCQRLRSLPGGDRIPILMITVLDDQDSVDRAFAVGATDYITKPIYWAVLSQRVRRLLAAAQALTQAEQATQQLQSLQQWDALLAEILQRLCKSTPVLTLLDFTVAKLRVQLEVERVILYTLGDQSIVESVAPGYPSVLELCLADPGLEEEYKTVYQQGQIVAIDDIEQEDIEQTELSDVAIAQLTPLKAKAVLIVPLISHGQRLGGLCVHQCITPRHWDQPTTERLTNLSNLLAIALLMNIN